MPTSAFALTNQRILVTGGAGFLGRQVIEQLCQAGADRAKITIPRSRDCDLRQMSNCQRAVDQQDIVIHLAAHVGGIGLNQEKPAELFYDNLMMGTQLIHAAYEAGVKKFVCVGTICAYPKFTPVPFQEDDLWLGYPEETNAPYGIAKKALLVQLQAYRQQYGFDGIYLLPVNLYGPEDNFDPRSSHVIPALIRKVHEAQQRGDREIQVWGDGSPSREFLYATDAARGIVLATQHYSDVAPVNLGTGQEISIRALITLICELMDFQGEIVWQPDKPNGQPRRCLDVERAKTAFGFTAEVDFKQGLQTTIAWYQQQAASRSTVLAPGVLHGVHHVAFNVKDMQASRHFYGSILGLHELTGAEVPETLKELVAQGKVANFVLPDGTVLDLFSEPDLSPAAPDPRQQFTRANHLAFAIAPDRFDQAVEVLRHHQIDIDHGPVNRPTGRGIYFYDPDGFLLEIRCDP